MSLEERISSYLRSRSPRIKRDSIKRIIIIVFFSGFLYGTFAYPPKDGGVQFFLAIVWIGGGWLLAVSPLRLNLELLRSLRSVTPEGVLNQLTAYGERDTIIRQIEGELSDPIFKKSTLLDHPHFFATNNWLLDFTMLPGNFAMRVSDIGSLAGSMTTSSGGMRFHYFFIAYDRSGSNPLVIPIYYLKDQRAFYQFLKSRNPNFRFDYPDSLRRYFQRVVKE